MVNVSLIMKMSQKRVSIILNDNHMEMSQKWVSIILSLFAHIVLICTKF